MRAFFLFTLLLATPTAQAISLTNASVSYNSCLNPCVGGTQTGSTGAHLGGSVVISGVNAASFDLSARAAYGSLDASVLAYLGSQSGVLPTLLTFSATASFSDSLLFWIGGGDGFLQFDYHVPIGGTTSGICRLGSATTSFGAFTSHLSCIGGGQQSPLIPFSEGTPFPIAATVLALGGGPLPNGFSLESPTVDFQLTSISVFDSNANRLTSFMYTSESGTTYAVPGGTFVPVPEPPSGSFMSLSFLFAALLWCRRTVDARGTTPPKTYESMVRSAGKAPLPVGVS